MNEKQLAAINELVEIHVFGNPKPDPITNAQAELENGGMASCFAIMMPGWRADIDWGTVIREKTHRMPVVWRTQEEYTRSWDAAGAVVDAMERQGRKVTIETGFFSGKHVADVVISGSMQTIIQTGKVDSGSCVHESTPLAICLAALRALGHSAEVQKIKENGK